MIRQSTGKAKAIFDLSRGRQALLSVAQPALAAVLALGAMPDRRTMAVGLVAATAGYLAVFSLNDVLDRRSDHLALQAGKAEAHGFDLDTAFERHPLASGMLPVGFGFAWVGLLALVAAVCAWSLNPWCLALFGAAAGLECLYCSLRSRTWTKTLVSGLMVGIGALAGWVAVAPLDSRAIIFVAFLGIWEIAGRNLPNDMSDLDADSAVGLTTVATVFGPSRSAHAVLVGSFATAALVPALGLSVAAAVLAFLFVIWTMSAPAVALMREPTPPRAAAYFNRASLLPALVFLVAAAQWLTGQVV